MPELSYKLLAKSTRYKKRREENYVYNTTNKVPLFFVILYVSLAQLSLVFSGGGGGDIVCNMNAHKLSF